MLQIVVDLSWEVRGGEAGDLELKHQKEKLYRMYVLKGGSGSKPGLHMRFGEGGSIQTREEKAKEIM